MLIKPYLYFFFIGFVVLLIILLTKVKTITKPKKYMLFTSFKITNKKITIISAMIYYIIFVGLIFYLRINKSDFSLDLHPIFQLIRFLLKDTLIACYSITIIILILLISLFILKKLKLYFEDELLKMHLVLMVSKTIDQRTLYFNVMFKMMHLCSINAIIRMILQPLTFAVYLLKNTKYFHFGSKILALSFRFLQKIFDMKYNILILPSLIFYDMYFNDFVISLIFKFLPFYFIYTLYYNWNNFFFEENAIDNRNTAIILYDLYYNTHKIKYFYLEKEDWDFLKLYIHLKLRGTDQQFNTDISTLTQRVIYYGRYTLHDENLQLYVNENIPSQQIILKNYTLNERVTILHEFFPDDHMVNNKEKHPQTPDQNKQQEKDETKSL